MGHNWPQYFSKYFVSVHRLGHIPIYDWYDRWYVRKNQYLTFLFHTFYSECVFFRTRCFHLVPNFIKWAWGIGDGSGGGGGPVVELVVMVCPFCCSHLVQETGRLIYNGERERKQRTKTKNSRGTNIYVHLTICLDIASEKQKERERTPDNFYLVFVRWTKAAIIIQKRTYSDCQNSATTLEKWHWRKTSKVWKFFMLLDSKDHSSFITYYRERQEKLD